MSISSLINPTGSVSVQDDLWHIAHSTLSGETDFKYVFDIYNGATQLIRSKVFPEPTNGRGYFNAAKVVGNEMTFAWFTPVASGSNAMALYLPNASGEKSITYQVRVGEELTGTTTLNLASGTVTAYNYVPGPFNRRQSNYSVFDEMFLTNRPKYATAKLGEKILVPFQGNGTFVFALYAYNYSNQLVAYHESTSSVVVSNNYIQMDIGSVAVNSAMGNQERIHSGIKYYDIDILRNGKSVTQKFRVFVECDPRYTTINLYFINQYGMFDTARFGLASRLNMNVERKQFERRDYSFTNTSVNYFDANNVYRESVVNFGSKSEWQYKLTMDYPTDAEYQWLAELINSPQIFAEIDGDYYPVSITDTNYEYSKNQNNKLKAFEVTINLNQKRYGFQR
jgi:hypothetical protein